MGFSCIFFSNQSIDVDYNHSMSLTLLSFWALLQYVARLKSVQPQQYHCWCRWWFGIEKGAIVLFAFWLLQPIWEKPINPLVHWDGIGVFLIAQLRSIRLLDSILANTRLPSIHPIRGLSGIPLSISGGLWPGHQRALAIAGFYADHQWEKIGGKNSEETPPKVDMRVNP